MLQLSALVERHRFIRAVCRFHSASEDDIVFPAVLRIRAASPGGGAFGGGRASPAAAAAAPAGAGQSPGDAAAQRQASGEAGGRQQEAGGGGKQQEAGRPRLACQDDHEEETSKLEELGRLLGAVKAHARWAGAPAKPPAGHARFGQYKA